MHGNEKIVIEFPRVIGPGGTPIKCKREEDACRNLKRIPVRYQDPVLWASLVSFSPQRYEF